MSDASRIREPAPFLIGGMDSDIEDLLRSAGGTIIEGERQEHRPEPRALLRLSSHDLAIASDLCRLHGWATETIHRPQGSLLAVPLVTAARIMELLDHRGVRPSAMTVQTG